MQVLVLGPLEARVDGREIPLGATKQRAVLAMLALHANATVSADELMEGLWGEHPPSSAPKMVQQYVSQLRRLLAEGDAGEATILTRGRGYELRIPPDDVDAARFVRLVSRGAPRQALSLWRGGALDDIADEPFAAVEIRRLQELRLDALEQAIDADLDDGLHSELIGELEVLISENPLSERLHGQLMLALYRSGRQAEALEAYRRARRRLVDEIGIEPGPELQRLHDAMLRHDASLDAPPPRGLPAELDVSVPLFGRDAALAQLRETWSRALDGRSTTVVLAGAPGSGRTRLAAELAREVHEQGGLVLYGAQAGHRIARPALLVVDDAAQPGPDGAPVLRVVTGGGAAPANADVIRLDPLVGEAIAAIARLYGQEHQAERLAERSGGLPGEAHRLASRWAQEEAERRVLDEARRTAGEREGLRQAERRLEGSVADLQSTRAEAERHEARRVTVVCPYKGLASFDRADADFFFGRDRLIAEMVARLVGAPLLGVVGASGSGKSSVLRAGLLPELAKGVLPGSERWSQVVMRPGGHPEAVLQRVTARVRPGRRLLIAVDQFEEVFTLCRDPAERAAFVAALVDAARDPERDAAVLLAIRADFYGRCAEYPALGALLGANQLLVGAMRRDELRRAIELPAQRAELHVEPDLVDALLADTAEEPGALPLLSTTLLELWQHRDGDRLRLADYERTGGVRGAVARMAETAYARLDLDQQPVARRILLRLAGDEGAGGRVRRRVPLAELEGGEVLDALADSRLVTVSEGTAEVAHEALLEEWPRLRGWLEEDAAGRRVHAQLMQAAREWSDDREHAELYRGARLASALEWRAEHEPELNANEQRFLDASRLASERARRRIQLLLAGVTALLAITVAGGLVALHQRGRARDEARVAEAQRLGAQALNTDAVDRSLLLARQGVALDPGPATEANLLAALRRSPAVVGAMRPGISGLTGVVLPPRGGVLAVSDLNGAVAFLDPATRRRLAVYRPATGTTGGAFIASPDGSLVASVEADYQSQFIGLFDPRTRRLVAEQSGSVFVDTFESALFSPDSRQLFAEGTRLDDGSVHLWRWAVPGGGQFRDEGPMPGHHSRLLAFVGSRLATYSTVDRAVTIRDPATLRAERRYALPSGFGTLAASSAGLVAIAMRDGSVQLLDLRTGRVRTAAGRHDAPVTTLAFSPDGRVLVTAGSDDRMIVWDTRTAAATETLETGAAGTIEGLAVTPDDRTAYSAGRDGTVLIWDLQGSRRFERPLRVGAGAGLAGTALVASARGPRFAAIDDEGAVDVFQSRSLVLEGRIRLGGGRRALAAAISPDGRSLAVSDVAGKVQFWDARNRKPLGPATDAHAYDATSVAYSGDGRWLVTGGSDPTVRLWDARRRATRNTIQINSAADLSLNPQGTLLAITLSNRNFAGDLELLSVPDLQLVRYVRTGLGTVGRFTPDGRSLIYGDREGRVWIYDTRTWKPRGAPITLTSPIRTADVSPDDRTLATTAVDGTVGLWDLRSGRSIGTDPPRAAGDLVGAGFIDGGRQLAVVHGRGGFAWDLRPASWERHACAVAGRTLTRAEWNDVLPDRPYDPACR